MFRIFDEKLSEIAEPLIVDAAKSFDAGNFLHGKNEADKALCELFFKVRKFSDLGLSIVGKLDFFSLRFFSWFSNDADHMCECPIFSAEARFCYYSIRHLTVAF